LWHDSRIAFVAFGVLGLIGTLLQFLNASLRPAQCVEVVSPSNLAAELRQKKASYLGRGAVEARLLSEDGAVEIHTQAGARDGSTFGFDPASALSALANAASAFPLEVANSARNFPRHRRETSLKVNGWTLRRLNTKR
jgi:hypothetical protein